MHPVSANVLDCRIHMEDRHTRRTFVTISSLDECELSLADNRRGLTVVKRQNKTGETQTTCRDHRLYYVAPQHVVFSLEYY